MALDAPIRSLRTASEVVGFAKDLENELDECADTIGRSWPELAEIASALSIRAGKNVKAIERTYYGGISDALESGFVFQMDVSPLAKACDAQEAETPAEAIRSLVTHCTGTLSFYREAAAQCNRLFTDLSRLFTRIVRERERSLDVVRRFSERWSLDGTDR